MWASSWVKPEPAGVRAVLPIFMTVHGPQLKVTQGRSRSCGFWTCKSACGPGSSWFDPIPLSSTSVKYILSVVVVMADRFQRSS